MRTTSDCSDAAPGWERFKQLAIDQGSARRVEGYRGYSAMRRRGATAGMIASSRAEMENLQS